MSNAFAYATECPASFKAVITHVASEYKWVKLYVQKDYDSVAEIEEYLEQNEQSLCKQSGYLHQGQLPLGTPCFARFSDNKWYRAAVSAWPKSDTTFVEVTFIDYGNPEIVSVADVRKGDEEIFMTPPLAMECFLDGIDVNLIQPKDASQLIEHIKGLLLYEEVTLNILRNERVLEMENCIRPIVSVTLPQGGQLVDHLAAKSQPLPAFKYLALPLDSTHEVYVSHVDDMDNVYLHLAAKDPADLTEKIQCYCASASLPPAPAVKEGMACLTRFSEDGSMYRSLVTSVAGASCRVLFVDYGNSEGKAVHDLLTIPISLLDEPAYAHHCRVSNLDMDVDAFRNATADVPIMCKFVSRCGPTKYAIELSQVPSLDGPAHGGPVPQPMSIQKLRFDPDTTFVMYISFIESIELMYGQLKETAEDIDHISIQLGSECQTASSEALDIRPGAAVACLYEGTWYRAEVIDAAQKVTVWITDYGDTALIDKKDIRPLDQKYLLQPAYAVKLTLEGYQCDPGNLDAATKALQDLVLDVEVRVHIVESSPDGLHVARIFVGDPPVSVTRKLPPPAHSVKVPAPTLAATERLVVMAVVPPHTFFGQLAKYSAEDLDALQESLLQHYSSVTRDIGFVPVLGQDVACKFSEDGCFYRARVISIEGGGRYGVFYMDYGNREVVAAENIHPLAAVFTQMPQFGILCRLEAAPSEDVVSRLLTETDGDVEVRIVRQDEEVHWVILAGTPGGTVPTRQPAPPAVLQPPPPSSVPAVVAAHDLATMLRAEMEVGQAASVEVVFVASPAEFYCQMKVHEAELNALMDAIASLESEPPLPTAMLEVNMPCVALYHEDAGWYRARVIEPTQGGARVFFVDYGNSEAVQCGCLRVLPPQYARLPEQAVKCKLSGVQPTLGSLWSNDATERFDELVSAQTTTVKVVSKCGICHEVELTLPNGSMATTVLVQEGFASLSTAPVHGDSPPLRATPDVSFHYQSLTPGTPVEVAVSWVLNPAEVFVQPTSTADQLEALMERLQMHYALSRAEPVRPGQACVAKFSEDGNWYRARATHSKGGKLGVQYVDYGNCEEVDVSDVRQIVPSFAELPAQAFRCRIMGVRPPGPCWPTLAPGGPMDDIMSGILICRSIGEDSGVNHVSFERPTDHASVADLLVSLGLAWSTGGKCESVSEASITSRPRMCILPVEVPFRAGDYVDVKVCAAVSLDEVWCCTLHSLDPIADALLEAAKNTKKLVNPVAGEGCIAIAPSGEWARAIVRSRVSPAKIEVFFADIGIVQTVHHANAKPMSLDLTGLPAQAFQCCLVADGRKVSGESVQTLVDKELVLEVKSVRDSCVVGSLFDTSGGGEVNVLDSLAAGGSLAVAKDMTAAKAETTQRPPYHRGRDSGSHIIVPCYAPLSKITGKMAAYVMHVEELNCFYVMRKDQESELESLADLIQQRYGGGNGEAVQPIPKMPCIAISSEDSLWYRARVVAPLSDSRALVHFIDYGNTDETTELRAVASEFLETPPFCYKCKLEGARELVNIPDVIEKFTKLISDSEIEMEVVTWGHEVTVRLSLDGADIATQLRQQAGVAAPVEVGGRKFTTTPLEGEVICVISHVDSLDSFYASPADKEDPLADFCAQVQDALVAKNVVVSNPKVGMPCCALFSEDEQWYRAVVLKAGSPLKVRFVDYGNSETVDSVAEIPDELFDVPTFCFSCRLDGNFKGSDGVTRLKDMAEQVQVKIVEWGEPATVKLFTTDGTDLSAQLGGEAMTDGALENVASEKYLQVEVPLHVKTLVDVCHINSPLDFYVNLSDHAAKLDEVAAILEEPQSRSEGFDPTVGSLCTALYTDGVTYRAVVLEKSEARVRVLFVDYGNVESVEPKDVFCLPASLTTIPALAVHCRLDSDVHSVSSDKACEKFRELVEDRTQSLLAEFLQQKDCTYIVRLLDMGIDILTSITGKCNEAESSVDLDLTDATAKSLASEAGHAEEKSVFEEPAAESEIVKPDEAEVDSAISATSTPEAEQVDAIVQDELSNDSYGAEEDVPALGSVPAEDKATVQDETAVDNSPKVPADDKSGAEASQASGSIPVEDKATVQDEVLVSDTEESAAHSGSMPADVERAVLEDEPAAAAGHDTGTLEAVSDSITTKDESAGDASRPGASEVPNCMPTEREKAVVQDEAAVEDSPRLARDEPTVLSDNENAAVQDGPAVDDPSKSVAVEDEASESTSAEAEKVAMNDETALDVSSGSAAAEDGADALKSSHVQVQDESQKEMACVPLNSEAGDSDYGKPQTTEQDSRTTEDDEACKKAEEDSSPQSDVPAADTNALAPLGVTAEEQPDDGAVCDDNLQESGDKQEAPGSVTADAKDIPDTTQVENVIPQDLELQICNGSIESLSSGDSASKKPSKDSTASILAASTCNGDGNVPEAGSSSSTKDCAASTTSATGPAVCAPQKAVD